MNKRRVLELKFRDYLKERTTERQVKTYVGSELEGLVTGFLLTQVNGVETSHDKALHKHIVSNAKRTVCDDCKHKGTSKWLDPCHTCREGDLKEQTDC